MGRQSMTKHQAHTHSHTHKQFSIVNPPTCIFLGRKLDNPKDTHVNMVNSTIIQAQDWTGDPKVMRQQCYPLHHHDIQYNKELSFFKNFRYEIYVANSWCGVLVVVVVELVLHSIHIVSVISIAVKAKSIVIKRSGSRADPWGTP